MTITIRAAEQEDQEAWLALRHALWHDEERAELFAEMESLRANRDALNLIAWAGDDAIGLLEVEIRKEAPGSEGKPIPYLEGWFVAEGFRRQGVGRALVEAAEAWARAKGFAAMASDTIEVYPASPAAHAALGYQVVATSIQPEDGFTWHFHKWL